MNMLNEKINAYFEKVDQLGWDPGLKSMKELLRRLGNPQEEFPVIHIAGTNGKGSTLAYLSSILQSAGFTVGKFNSPELIRRNELISINGEEIADPEMEQLLQKIETASDEMIKEGFRHPTSFEVMAALAFLHFSSSVDLALIETGMGGRLDATNVVTRPILCLVSPIDLDHQAFLGNTLAAIAKEKAGIFRLSVPIVSAPQAPEAKAVLLAEAKALSAEIKWINPSKIEIHESKKELRFSLEGREFHSKMLGSHQAVNAAVAIEAARILGKCGWHVTEADLQRGIQDARWPGRFEILRENPLVVLDGAHNAQGMNALNQTRKQFFQGAYQAVVGVLGDKAMGSGFYEILKDADGIWTATPESPRALPARQLSESLGSMGLQSSPKEELDVLVESILDLQKPCLIFGSLYLIGPLRDALIRRGKDDKRFDR